MTSLYKTPAGEQAVMALYDAALERWPLPYDTQTIPTPYGDTFVITCGVQDGPPLVLLHGAGSNSAIWAGDVAVYGKQYRVYAIDLLGEAGKSAPNRPAWDSPAYGEWLAAALDALGLERVTLMGISQGGWTALQFATAHPERVTALALLTPGGVVPDKLSFVLRVVPLMLMGRWGIRRAVRILFADQPVPDGVEEIMITITSQFKARMGVLPIYSNEELQRLTMPVLLLGGDQDALRDIPKIAARLREFVPRLEVTIIPGAGHALLDTTGPVMAFLKAEAHA